MGLQQSKSQRELARNDSLLSQNENTSNQADKSVTGETVPIVKRKAIPEATKKFKGLADLGTVRGRKGGPLLAATSAPRKASIDGHNSGAFNDHDATLATEQNVKVHANEQQRDAPAHNTLPPTPDEDKSAGPAQPRKVALGLPSNPRSKAPISPGHIRGKSSTGFHLLKVRIQLPFPSPVFFR